jgi:hypothetical protein
LTIAVILILGILWIAVLVPPILRARGQQGHSGAVGDFTHRLTHVGRALGHRDRSPGRRSSQGVYAPATPYAHATGMSAQQKRRRDVLLVLGGAVAVTFLLAVVTRSTPIIGLFVLALAALGGYVYLLLQYKQRAAERSAKVHYIGAPRGVPAPAYSSSLAGAPSASVSRRLAPLRSTAAR